MDEQIDYTARAIAKIEKIRKEKERKTEAKAQERTIEFIKECIVTSENRIRFNLPKELKGKLKPKDKVRVNVIFTYYEK
jgi:hypothetical protein